MISLKFNPHKPIEMFDSLIDESLQRQILVAVYSQYQAAYNHCQEVFDSPARGDILPHYRRAMIEDALCELAGPQKANKSTSMKNRARNCSHNLLLIRDRIVLTQSKVDRKALLPRDAFFRGSYAKSPQMEFDFAKDEASDRLNEEQGILYGIIVHCPSSSSRLPEFVDVIFPDSGYKHVVETLALMERYREIVQRYEPTVEVIESEIEQKLQIKRVSESKANA